MADNSSSVSLAWLSLIEAFASMKQVNISTLNDLIIRAPEFSDDMGKSTREMLALRCLEGLFGLNTGMTNDVPSAPDLKIRFNLSESCEDVLQHILHEISISNLRMAGPELLKWDVHPFIMHKRVFLPKCSLEQLRDTILEDTHPSVSFFRERSGIAIRNECDDRNPVDDGDPNALSWRSDGSGTDCQIKAASGKLIALTSENGNGLLQEDSPNRILLPSKRDRNYSANENLVEQFHELGTENGGDLHLNAKKSKLGSSSIIKSVGQDLVPLHSNERLDDSSGRTILDTEREGCDLAKKFQVGGLEGNRVSEDVHDGCVSPKRIEQISDVNDDEVQHNQLQSCNNNKLPQDTAGDGPYQDISIDRAKDDIECCLEPKTCNRAILNGTQQNISNGAAKDNREGKVPIDASSDGSNRKITNEAEDNMEHYCELEKLSDTDGYHNEKIDIISKKHSFLSSQSTFSQDSLSTADWTEQNLCMKCNKAGQLLVCSASGCPLVVHENCLGFSASFNNKGNFYCPFCAYSLAISEYLEAKKNASLARKDLAAFIAMDINHQREKRSKIFLHKKYQNEARQNGDVNLLVKSHGNGNLREEEDRQAEHNGEHVNQVEEEEDGKPEAEHNGEHVNQVEDVKTDHNGEHVNQVEDGKADHNGEHVNQVDNHQIRESMDDNRQAEPSVLSVYDNLSHREEEATVIRGAFCVCTEQKQGVGKMVEECQSVRGLEGQQNQVPANSYCEGDNSCFRDAETIIVSWRQAEVGIQQEVLQQQAADPSQEPACEPNIDADDASEDKIDKSIVSNYSIRFQSREKCYNYPVIPMSRRKKVAWTAEEEKILKEGVRRFSSVGDRNIPWKRIFEFGSTVFQKGRTPGDLKDKWRNICKGKPKPK